ncbi:MAG TPA: hypothetical protein VF406_01075 [Thermodesulfobacteriota bacterium]
MAEHTAPTDWQNPWVWTVAALLIGGLLFANFARTSATDTKATGWELNYGRTGAGNGVPSSTAVPDALKGKYR